MMNNISWFHLRNVYKKLERKLLKGFYALYVIRNARHQALTHVRIGFILNVTVKQQRTFVVSATRLFNSLVFCLEFRLYSI